MIQISEIVTKVTQLKLGGELAHLSKLIESHKKKADDSIVDFLQLIVNVPDEFFARENMPESWSARSYSSAMESLWRILHQETIKEDLIGEMGQEEFDDVSEGILVYKRKYMNEYKKFTRKKKKGDNDAISDVINVDAEGIQLPELQEEGDGVPPPRSASNQEAEENQRIKSPNIQACVENIIDMLQRYIDVETDEFKILYLNIVKEKLVMLTSKDNMCM